MQQKAHVRSDTGGDEDSAADPLSTWTYPNSYQLHDFYTRKLI